MMSTLAINHATFSYDGTSTVFSDLSCIIEDRQVFGILGPNGIGKSTLLKAIMNLHHLESGCIILDGRDVRDYPANELAKRIAYIPQSYQMAFPYRVLDMVMMGRTPHLNSMNRPSTDDYGKAMDAITALKLNPFIYRPCTQLSGGQLQLVMLARAMAQEADFLILDEPTSHLDYGKQMETLHLIKRMRDHGVGVIFTSHNPDHAFLICDKVAIMDGGSFVDVGRPEDVVTENNLRRIYGLDIQILPYGKQERGRVCVPMEDELDVIEQSYDRVPDG